MAAGKVINYGRFINPLSKNRAPSPLRVLSGLLSKAPPGTISLAIGLPNPDIFPFGETTVKLKDGKSLVLKDADMKIALQYAPSPGIQELRHQLIDMQNALHNPPQKVDLLVTAGGQDGLCKAIEMVLNPGDYVLLEEPAYPGTLGMLNPYKPRYLVVDTDAEGMVPDSLRAALSPWPAADAAEPGSDLPKILYTVPNGHNPAGTSIPLHRRRQIYEIAQQYDLLILEDDPYYHLQFSEERIPSFLSMDVDGRVIRFDSFSKVLSAGLRLGFCTGPPHLLDRIMLHTMVSSLHTGALPQVIVSKLLRTWGLDGFLEHADKGKVFYKEQRRKMADAAKRHLTGLCEWNEPAAGMFLWMKVLGVYDTSDMIARAIDKQVVLAPGNAFMTDSSAPCPYLRASFSVASEEEMDLGFQRLAELIRDEQKLRSEEKQRL